MAWLTWQKHKPKMGMGESFKFLLDSKYVRDLATLVVAYGVSINLVEVTWKSKIKAQVSRGRSLDWTGTGMIYTDVALIARRDL